MHDPHLTVEYLPIEELQPYERNARKHEPRDIAAIRKSIEDFGFNDPIGIWHDTIVEGHGRLFAAKLLGMEQVPIIRLDNLTDEQRRAYGIAHNKTAELSEWSYERVTAEINSLDINMALFGFWEKDESAEPPSPEMKPGNGVGKDEETSDAGVVCPRCGAWVPKS